MAFDITPRRYTPELLAADAVQVRNVALVMSTLPPWPGDRRELGLYMGARRGELHPDEVCQAATILRDLADAMKGKPAAEELIYCDCPPCGCA